MSDEDDRKRAIEAARARSGWLATKLGQYSDWANTEPLKAPLERALPGLKPSADKLMQAQYDSHAEQRRREQQEFDLQAIKAKRQAVEDAVRSAKAPVDIGDIDAPAVRQPIQMQREFSNDQEKEAYLERVRQAMKKAAAAK